MKRLFSFSLLSLFLLQLAALPALCQSTEEILQKMIEAQGGREALEKIKDTKLQGSIELVQYGMSGSFVVYHKEPNKMRIDVEVIGMVITQAFDGKTAWAVNPQTGTAEEMAEQTAEYFKREAIGIDSLLNPEKIGITYAFKETEKIEEKDYLVLEQTHSDGFKATFYVDAETFLTYKTKATTLNQMGVEVEAETFVSDYKKIDGIMVSHSMSVFQEGEEAMTMTFTDVKFNSDLEDSLFKMKK